MATAYQSIGTDPELEIRRRILQLKRLQKKRRAMKDLWFMDKYVLGYKDMTSKDRFHGEMCDFVTDPENDFSLVLEPRGSLKSSCITIGEPIRRIVNDPNIRILIASEEFSAAKKFGEEIKGHFEDNEEFRRLFGDFVGKKKWSEHEMTVSKRTRRRKEPTITCAGVDVTKVGMHYDLIIIDDPHSAKNITTTEQIEKVITWYKLVLSLLDPGGRLIVIGTRWHYDELFGWLIDQERLRQEAGRKRRFNVLQKKAIIRGKLSENTKDEDLLWPERLSKDFLLDTKLDQGPYIFSCQYQNEPVDEDSAVFKRSWFRFYDPDEVNDTLPCFTTVDPMRDEEGKDFCSIITCSLDSNWRAYVREVRRGKWDEHETLEQIFLAWKRWRPQKIGFETVAWQKSYYKFMKAEMLRRQMHMPIMELKTDTKMTKRMRIRGLVPYMKAGLYLFPGTSVSRLRGNMAILADELLRFPRLKNDDCVDGLAYMDQLMQRPMVSKILKLAPAGSFKAVRERIKRKTTKKKFGLLTAA